MEFDRQEIKLMDQKKVFAEGGDKYYFPESELDFIKRNFNNCLVELHQNGYNENSSYFIVNQHIDCNERRYDKKTFLHNGKLLSTKEICNNCSQLIHKYLDECNGREFVPIEQFKVKDDNELLKLKTGYVHETDFDSKINFSTDLIIKRKLEYKKRGKIRTLNEMVRKEFCHNCFKFATGSCKDGFKINSYRNIKECHETEEEAIWFTKREIIKNFGSLSRFFNFMLMCGKEIEYNDPFTKRKSRRILSVPVRINGRYGFKMVSARYPYKLKSWYNKDKKKTREDYISLSQLKKIYPDKYRKEKYSKKYEEALCTAYLFMKRGQNEPGGYCTINGHGNYLVSVGLRLSNLEVAYLRTESGDSRGIYEVSHYHLRQLADNVRL